MSCISNSLSAFLSEFTAAFNRSNWSVRLSSFEILNALRSNFSEFDSSWPLTSRVKLRWLSAGTTVTDDPWLSMTLFKYVSNDLDSFNSLSNICRSRSVLSLASTCDDSSCRLKLTSFIEEMSQALVSDRREYNNELLADDGDSESLRCLKRCRSKVTFLRLTAVRTIDSASVISTVHHKIHNTTSDEYQCKRLNRKKKTKMQWIDRKWERDKNLLKILHRERCS